MKQITRYGVNNSLIKGFYLATAKKYVNVYSENKGMRFILSDVPLNALLTMKMTKEGKIVLPRILRNNLDAAENVELVKENLNEFFAVCNQKQVFAPPAGIDYEEKDLLLHGDYEEGEISYRKQENKISFPIDIVRKYLFDGNVKIIVHRGRRCCVEILRCNSGIEGLSSYNELKELYGAGLLKCCGNTVAFTECAALAAGNYGVHPPVSFMNAAGFNIDKNTVSLKARFYSDGIMLVPATEKSAVSGEDLNMVETPVKQINLCEECAGELGKGEGNDIGELIRIASEFINNQSDLGKKMKDLQDEHERMKSELENYKNEMEKARKLLAEGSMLIPAYT